MGGKRPSWNASGNPDSLHYDESTNMKYVGQGVGGQGRKKIMHRGDTIHITTSACQVPSSFSYERGTGAAEYKEKFAN
jgi:hypothetical protein